MKNLKKLIMAIMIFGTGIANSAVSLSYTTLTPSVVFGTSTVDIEVRLTKAAADDVVGFVIVTDFDAALTFASCTSSWPSGEGTLDNCVGISGNTAVSISESSEGIPSDGLIATLTFNTSTTAIGGPYVISARVDAGVPLPQQTSSVPVSTQLDSWTDGSITITSAPAPVYGSNPASGTTLTINHVQNFGTDTATLEVQNVGNASPLTTTCSIGAESTSGVFSVSPSTSFDINQGNTADVTVSCLNTAALATHTATLTCSSNGGAAAAYPLECIISAPGDAVFGESPATGSTTNLTLASGPLLGGSTQTVAGQDLVLSNTASAGNSDLKIISCAEAGAAEVTVTNPIANGTLIAPGASASAVTFGCDVSGAAAAPATFTKTYTCDHDVNTSNPDAAVQTVYTYTCGTRAATSAGTPADGTSSNANITAPPGGSTTNTVVSFSETNNEGVDITNLSCTIPAGDFAVVTAMPATIPAGGSIGVDVSFTDPGAAGPYVDVMTCTYTDSSGVLATVTVNLSGNVQAIVVPTMSFLGYVAMMIGLLLVGSFGFRRRA